MKIGFLGNANNYPFMLARAFKKLGHDVLFIIDSGSSINRPEFRYKDITYPYPGWILDFQGLSLWDYPGDNYRVDEVVEALSSCDFIVLNEFGLSLWPRIKRPLVAFLTGTDLEILSDYRYADLVTGTSDFEVYAIKNILSWRRIYKKNSYRKYLLGLIKSQRSAIAAARVVNYFPKLLVPNADRILAGLMVEDSRRIYCMQSEIGSRDYVPQPNNKIIRLFNVARIQWKKPQSNFICELDYKGTDILLAGVAMYVAKRHSTVEIRLVRKGCDVEETLKLIDNFGLGPYVTWLDEMNQEEIFKEYQGADIVFDHFGKGMFGMGTLDAMAVGRPVITNGRFDALKFSVDELPPICNAETAEDICAHLENLTRDSLLRESIGMKSRAYVEKYCDPVRYAKIILEKFENEHNK